MTPTNQLILPLAPSTNFSRQAWIQDASNQQAAAWVNQWPDWPAPRIVCVHGEEGSGKTHLAHLWADQAKGVHMDATQAAEKSPYETFTTKQPIALDDVEAVADQEWLFHFYNFIQDTGGSALLLATTPPSRWGVTLPDLSSRLQTIISVEILRPDEHALKAIMIKQFRDRGLIVKPEVVDYLLKLSERSFAQTNRWVLELDRVAATKGRSITIPLIREIFASESAV
ncbi:HdaA/DnaA family protein [Candidatus Finniella inopinata]|uniref:Hda lid domain-containing protein n=1 Tax=Candidatus Finniella inopinata TaxID=1696036 RepID=A0A4Q7DF81_9PROT|nr:DnaA/Hda family protein [Candidatus Finniella inopinata]RZI45353.1 hypothetical protein EQU50_07435 [Candidatus Finniella inopinata]